MEDAPGCRRNRDDTALDTLCPLQSAERAGEFGYWRMDVATRMVECSPGMFAVTGGVTVELPVNQAVLSAADKIHEDRGRLEAAVDDAIRERRSSNAATAQGHNRTGSRRAATWSATSAASRLRSSA